MSAGKGDKPRNCFSKKYKNNYDEIDWGRKNNDLANSTKTSYFSSDKNLSTNGVKSLCSCLSDTNLLKTL